MSTRKRSRIRIPGWILDLSLPRDEVGDSIRGDLLEEYERIATERSQVEATRWYWRHAVGVAGRTIWDRATDRLPVPEPRTVHGRRERDPMINRIGRDVRYAFRTLRRSPGFTGVAIATLAIGIGANAAIFSAVNGVLLKPLAFDDADRLVGVWHTAPGLDYPQIPLSGDTYALMRDNNAVFEELALITGAGGILTGNGDPERVAASAVTHTFFPLLGIEPALGRLFTAEEDMPDVPRVVLLTHGLWERRYGGDPGMVGRTIELDGAPVEVIGVLPEGFDYLGNESALWWPMGIDVTNPPTGSFSFNGLGKLLPGRTTEAAEANLAPLVDRLLEINAESENYVAFLENGRLATLVHPLKEDLIGDSRGPLLLLLGTVGFVLLIACANVANLVIVRSDARRREMAVRSALGAGRGVLARQFMAESGVLAVAGGVLGLMLAYLGVPALLRAAPDGLPRAEEIGIDGTVLLFTLGMVLLSVLLFAGLPMIRSFSASSFGALTSSRGSTAGKDRHRLRNLLVAGQTALALVLLVGSGLMIRSFNELRNVHPGFDPEGVLTFRVNLPDAQYTTAQGAAGFHMQLLERLAALPGVQRVGAVNSTPMGSNVSGTGHAIEDRPAAPGELPPILYTKYAAPGYFESMGIRLLEGRTLDRADHEQQLANVVVNAAVVNRVWPGESALGRRISFSSNDTTATWYTVVGVVEATRDAGLDEDPRELVYYPLVGANGDEDWTVRNLTYTVKTAGLPTALSGPARAEVWALDGNLPVTQIRPMQEILDQSTARISFTMMSLAMSAVVALILGAIGLYGVVSYVVSERTREIGVRIALGAESGEVQRMVVGQGVKLSLLGLAIGLVASLGLTRLMESLLFGTSPTDPFTLVSTSLILLAVGATASYLPARRASAIDPVESLRAE